MSRWIRPPGPPTVWKIIDGQETLQDGTKKPVKYSIQEIPKNEYRIQEVIDLLCGDYMDDEPMAKCTGEYHNKTNHLITPTLP